MIKFWSAGLFACWVVLAVSEGAPGRELKIHPVAAESSGKRISGQTVPDLVFPIVSSDLDVISLPAAKRYLLTGGNQWQMHEAAGGSVKELSRGRVDGKAVSCGFVGGNPDKFFVSYQNRQGQMETLFYINCRPRRPRKIARSSRRVYRSDGQALLSQSQGNWDILEGAVRIEMVDDRGKRRELLDLPLPPGTELFQFARIQDELAGSVIVRQTRGGSVEVFKSGVKTQTVTLPPARGPVYLSLPDNVLKQDRGVAPLAMAGGPAVILVAVNESAEGPLMNLLGDPRLISRIRVFRFVPSDGLDPLWESETLQGYIPVMRLLDGMAIVPVVEASAKRTVVHEIHFPP